MGPSRKRARTKPPGVDISTASKQVKPVGEQTATPAQDPTRDNHNDAAEIKEDVSTHVKNMKAGAHFANQVSRARSMVYHILG